MKERKTPGTRGRLLSVVLLCGLLLVLAASLIYVPTGSLADLAPIRGPAAPTDGAAAPADGSAAVTSGSYDWFYEGLDKGGEFGHSVGTAGDVDGDGYDEVIVGAPKVTGAIYKEGMAYLFEGSGGGLSHIVPDWSAGGGVQGSLFGTSVGTAGDVNDDGYDDVIIGAPEYKAGDFKTGAVFVYYGSSGGLLSATPDWVFVGPMKNAEFGYSVGTAGDVNDDGYDDVIVGARWYSETLANENEGAAFVFYGSDTGLGDAPVWMALGGQAGAGFGSSVATAGDVDKDGFDDVVVGAPLYDGAYEEEGAAFVFFGSDVGLGSSPEWNAYGGKAEARYGVSAGGAGDVNGDGYDDVIVGAHWYSGTLGYEGAAFAYHGSDSGLEGQPRWSVRGSAPGGRFGVSVATAGDVNGDGYDDVIVGADLYTRDQAQEGAAFVYHGSPSGLQTRFGWHAEGDKAETGFGHSVGTAGDVNEGSYADLVVGAPLFRLDRDPRGRAFGYYGPKEIPEYTATYLPFVVRLYPEETP